MIITMSLCAILCALVMLYVLAPALRHKRSAKLTLIATFAVAALSLGLYLWAGSPDLATINAKTEIAMQESEINAALAKNPDDAEAMIRLAALQVYRKENNAQTIELLDRAAKKLPGDERIKFIRSMIKHPNTD